MALKQIPVLLMIGTCLGLLIEVNGQTILTQPSDISVTSGAEVKFICTLSEETTTLIWSRKDDNLIISNEAGLNPTLDEAKYKVTSSQASHELTIVNVDWSDGGEYGCTVGYVSAFATLLVLETPIITINPATVVAGQTATFMCEARFGGPLATSIKEAHMPALFSFLDKEIVEGDAVTDLTMPGSPTTTWWTLKQTFNKTIGEQTEQSEYVCEVRTNTPAYYEAATKLLDVQYAVKQPSIEPVRSDNIYFVGEMINCSASGNPEPSFQWVPLKSPSPHTVNSASLELLYEMIGPNEWVCRATNNVDNIPHQTDIIVTFDLVEGVPPDNEESTGNGSDDSWVIAVGVTIPILVLIVGAIVFVVFYTEKKKKEKKSKENDQPEAGHPPNVDEEPPYGNEEVKARKLKNKANGNDITHVPETAVDAENGINLSPTYDNAVYQQSEDDKPLNKSLSSSHPDLGLPAHLFATPIPVEGDAEHMGYGIQQAPAQMPEDVPPPRPPKVSPKPAPRHQPDTFV